MERNSNVVEQVLVCRNMVVTEDQVNPVMDAALSNGLEVTGLHAVDEK